MKRKNKTFRQTQGKQTGFTLIELIVSVTIIAVLTVAGVISYGGASKKSRDSRRMADLEKIRIALELYRQGTGSSYPNTGATNLTNALVGSYLQTMPIGPKNESYANNYVRESSYVYRICTPVEDAGSISADVSLCPAVPPGYVGNYKIKNP